MQNAKAYQSKVIDFMIERIEILYIHTSFPETTGEFSFSKEIQ